MINPSCHLVISSGRLAQPPVDEFLTALIERHERNAR
jgi:hypothetical protein